MKTVQEIYNNMKQYIAEAGNFTINDSGDMALRLMAAAQELQSMWAQTEYVMRQALPQTAVGESLDAHAQMRGISRKGATKAEGYISFCLNTAAAYDMGVPVGTVCITDDGSEFETVEPGFISRGGTQCTVAARALKPGSDGNVPANSVVYMENAPVGVVSCTNSAAFMGGCDAESDDELRSRIVHSYRRLSSGANAAFYELQALNTEGVNDVLVIPRPRGIGTVDVVITAANGYPSAQLIQSVQDKIDACREICVDVTVRAPVQVTTAVELTVSALSGYDANDVCTAVEAALREYYDPGVLGQSVLRSDISRVVYSVPGVSSFTIDMPTLDVEVDEDELAIINISAVSE